MFIARATSTLRFLARDRQKLNLYIVELEFELLGPCVGVWSDYLGGRETHVIRLQIYVGTFLCQVQGLILPQLLFGSLPQKDRFDGVPQLHVLQCQFVVFDLVRLDDLFQREISSRVLIDQVRYHLPGSGASQHGVVVDHAYGMQERFFEGGKYSPSVVYCHLDCNPNIAVPWSGVR